MSFAATENDDLQRAFFVLGRLTELATYSCDLEPMEIDEQLKDVASEIIPPYVEILHRARLAQAERFETWAKQSFPKVGRNDPCPCGSGKKYKKCCLN